MHVHYILVTGYSNIIVVLPHHCYTEEVILMSVHSVDSVYH